MTKAASTLDSAIRNATLTSPLPQPLPLVHLSIARWFNSIVGNGKLEPTKCTVFNEDLLYLFYGGVFYRPSSKPTRNATELPIAFVFDPSLLATVLRLYPLDTGALAAGKFGHWASVFDDFKNLLRVDGGGDIEIGSRLVRCLFGSNEEYLRGKADSGCVTHPPPLPQLYNFYVDDLTAHGADQRQCQIECQVASSVKLTRELLWVGFPESMTSDFAALCALTKPYVPQFYAYSSHVIRTPSEVAAQLELIAHNDVIKRYVRLP